MRLSSTLSVAALALALTAAPGILNYSFAQTQNSTDAGHHEDPDAATDVQEAAPAVNQPSSTVPTLNSTEAGRRNDPDAATDVRELKPAVNQRASTVPTLNSTEAGRRNDPDTATDVQEATSPKSPK